jgi:23S rRNA pseudouridine1911/1915/1917 synthase
VKSEKLDEFTVGVRLDKALVSAYPNYSRSNLVKLIESNHVLVNGQPSNASYKLKSDDDIAISFSLFNPHFPETEIPVIYENNDVIVLNKPTGMLTHSKGILNNEHSVANFIRNKLKGSPSWLDSNRAGIVHRLDRGTSGVIICAKNEISQKFLQKQFAKRNVKKVYLAMVSGELDISEGIIEVPIERNPKKPSTFRAGANGKTAITEYRVKNYSNNVSLIELMPMTGRTHQLRVHLAYIHHPIVGDTVYGGDKHYRLMLHASQLEITLPNSERCVFKAPTPKDFIL